jgi:hypothetical protein
MALGRKIVVRYLALVAAAFVLGYGIFGIREHGLWILLMAINLPGSWWWSHKWQRWRRR